MKINMFISFRLTTFVLSANINICLNKEEYGVMLHLDNVNIISFGIKKITSSDWLNLVNKSVFFHRMYYFYDSGVSGICRNKEIIEFKPRAFYFVPSNSLIKFNLNTDEHINHFYIDFSTQEISFAEKVFTMSFKDYPYLESFLSFVISYSAEHNIENVPYTHRYVLGQNDEPLINGIKSILTTFLILLSENNKIYKTSMNSVEKAVSFIQANYSRKILLDELCSVAYLSKNQLIRRFKVQYGTTPHNYIINYKMLIATNMIQSNFSLFEIASFLGYESVSSFSTAFKAHFGFPPSKLKQDDNSLKPY